MDMSTVFTQMAVLFLVMALGYIGNKTKVLNAGSNKLLSALILNITGPCTILSSVMDGSVMASGREALVFTLLILAALALAYLISWPLPRLLRVPGGDVGMVRFLLMFGNIGFMGYPVVQALYGNGGLFYVTLFNIPFNILLFSVGIILIAGKKGKPDFRLLLTPTLISSVLAVLIFAFQFQMPKIIVGTVSLVGNITSPGAMLVIGSTLAAIPFRDVFREKRLYPVALVKLIVIPAVIWLVLHFFVADQTTLGILIVESAMPTAAAATMLSLQYGGNDGLAAKGVFLTTLFSVVTIPLLLSVLF
jgi:predicted permease